MSFLTHSVALVSSDAVRPNNNNSNKLCDSGVNGQNETQYSTGMS